MPPETIIKNEFATLLYYPQSKIIHHQFHKPTFGKTFRNVLMQGLRILKQHHAILLEPTMHQGFNLLHDYIPCTPHST